MQQFGFKYFVGRIPLIIVTGAAGFIGSCTVSKLNQMGKRNILAVDSLNTTEKWQNLRHLQFMDYLDKSQLFEFLATEPLLDAVIHLGACSATTERDAGYLMENNYRYSLRLAQHCYSRGIRLIYASSAATYGDGNQGYDDRDDSSYLRSLKPLNMYGYSKHLFDIQAQQRGWIDAMVGLKFFNVYGPNEYFKGDMTSVIFKAFGQILEQGKVRLFKSYKDGFQDGEQLRDFVYVKDVVEAIHFFLENPKVNGLFNLGSGKARSFKDLAIATFQAMGRPVNIEFIEMPEVLRGKYQYFTEAKISKLRATGYARPFHSLEEGISDYVRNYLACDQASF